jgi:hypothetical protein
MWFFGAMMMGRCFMGPCSIRPRPIGPCSIGPCSIGPNRSLVPYMLSPLYCLVPSLFYDILKD